MTATTMEREAHKPASPIMSAEELLKKMRAGVEEVHHIFLRGVDIPVRILSQSEYNKIRKDAIASTVMEAGDETDKNIRIQKATLMLASTLNKGSGPMLSDKLLDAMTLDELSYIYGEYVALADKVNPNIQQMSDDELRALVEALKKNSYSAKDLSLRQLRVICTVFQDLIQRDAQPSPTVSSSGGQQ